MTNNPKSPTDSMSMERYLFQGEYWYAHPVGAMRISDMTSMHRLRSAEWLERNAVGIISIVEASRHEDVVNGTGTLGSVIELIGENARTWIKDTTLYRALTEG